MPTEAVADARGLDLPFASEITPREVFGDGWIGRVRQAQLLKANTALAGRQFIAPNFRKKPFYQDLIEVFPRQFRLNGTTHEFRPLA